MSNEPNYRSGVIHDVLVKPLVKYNDQRGWLSELFRSDSLPDGFNVAMSYISMTVPGVARGPHEHAEQADFFCFLGPGTFKVYLWDARKESPTYGIKQVLCCGVDEPLSVVVPPGVVHAYRNISSEDGIVFNAPDRLYAGEGKKSTVDEIRHEDDPGSPYFLD